MASSACSPPVAPRNSLAKRGYPPRRMDEVGVPVTQIGLEVVIGAAIMVVVIIVVAVLAFTRR